MHKLATHNISPINATAVGTALAGPLATRQSNKQNSICI